MDDPPGLKPQSNIKLHCLQKISESKVPQRGSDGLSHDTAAMVVECRNECKNCREVRSVQENNGTETKQIKRCDVKRIQKEEGKVCAFLDASWNEGFLK